MSNFPFLLLLTLVPLVGAVVVAVMGRDRANEESAKKTAVGFGFIELALAIWMFVSFDPDGERLQFVTSVNWIGPLGVKFALGADGIALMMIVLIALLVPLVMIASWQRESLGDDVNEPGSADPDRAPAGTRAQMFAWILLLEVFLVVVFAATDVFLFYVAFEAMLIPTYFLIGGYGSSQRRGVMPLVTLVKRSGKIFAKSAKMVSWIRSLCSLETPLTLWLATTHR